MNSLPSPMLAVHVHPSPVLAHDAVGHREAEAGALANVLGGEERLEDVRQVLGRDPRALVAHAHADAVRLGAAQVGGRGGALAGDGDLDRAVIVAGLDGVDHEVGEDLLDLPRVELGRGGRLALAQGQRDARLGGDRLEQRQRAPGDAAHVLRGALRASRAGEVEELADDAGHLVARLDDDAGVVDGLGGRRLAVGDHPGAGAHHVERRAQLVGDPRGELAHGHQPIGVAELLQGGDAGRRLGRAVLVGLDQALAHRVHLRATARRARRAGGARAAPRSHRAPRGAPCRRGRRTGRPTNQAPSPAEMAALITARRAVVSRVSPNVVRT